MPGSRSRKPRPGGAPGRPTDSTVFDDEVLVAQWHRAPTEEARAEAFRAIYSRFYPQVVRFFRFRGFSHPEVDDLAQEAFLRIYKSLADFRGEGRLAVWVFEVAANLHRNAVRERAALKRSGNEISLDSEGVPGLELSMRESQESPLIDQVLAHEQQVRVHRAIEMLPPQMRRCVLLRVERDLKYREIAALMRISIETVKAHLFQARQRLKDELSDDLGEIDL
jgi:RNA polymerase sigma-70 factor, ECF subfamily